jgi:hypothetical protein
MITLAAISLLGPAMLAGALLVALPIIAHLLHRHARRPVTFPSIRLLRATAARQSSIFRIRRRLLLAIRSLAVLLLVLAFAEPIWTARSHAGESADGAAGTTVVLLDASLSMRHADGGASLFERARGEASARIDRLAGGRDLAEVILADDRPRGLAGALTPNLDMLGVLLSEVSASEARADLGVALGLAAQRLAEGRGARRLVIVTDGQASNWREVIERSDSASDGSTNAAQASLPPGTAVEVVLVASGDRANASVETRGLSSERIAPRQPVAATFRFRAYGAGGERRVTARVTLDGEPIESRPILLLPGRPVDEVFVVSPERPGPRAVRVAIDHDGLVEDDAAHATILVGARRPIGILSDEDPSDSARATFYLVRALAPRGDDRDRFAPRPMRVEELSEAAIADLPTIIMGDCTRLDAQRVGALIAFVERGGNLLILCGGGALADNLAAIEMRSPGALPFMPGPAGNREGRLIGGPARTTLLAEFDDAALLGLGQMRVGRQRSASAVREDALHVLTFDDGTPALSLRRLGAGALAMLNLSASPRTGDLGRHGAFVALMQSLASDAGSEGFRPNHVGEAITLACGTAGSELGRPSVLDPQGEPLADAIFLRDRLGISASIERTLRAGMHRVENEGRTIAMAAVDVDPRESDPAALDAQAIGALVGGGAAVVAGSDLDSALLAANGTPFWWLALLAALVVLSLELALLAGWRR